MNVTVSISCLAEDIKEVMQKHGVPEEFHAMQLMRVLAAMESPTDKNSYNVDCFNLSETAQRIVEVLSQQAVPVGAIDFVFKEAGNVALGNTLVTTKRTMNQTLKEYLEANSCRKEVSNMCEEKEVVLCNKQEQPQRRSFDMQSTTEDILKGLERNEIPLAALDWVFQHVKKEAARRVVVSSKLPFQTF